MNESMGFEDWSDVAEHVGTEKIGAGKMTDEQREALHNIKAEQ